MKTRLLLLGALLLASAGVHAQEEKKTWKCTLLHAETGAKLRLDLYEESIEVPSMEMFGPMNGYMSGGKLYGLWMTTKTEELSPTTIRLRLSNDLGSETQECLLKVANDSVVTMELKGGTVMKRRDGNKLTKLPSQLTLKRIK
ncbi:MAG: hypothetical protein KBT12_01695 [Bacteroidales bacterium]|nr:hypothetical protein [Candidatus Physcousia equi]